MLGQIEHGVQNEPITKNRVLPLTTLFFENLIWVQEPLLNSWFNAQITQISIFILFVSVWVSFWECAFPVSIHKGLKRRKVIEAGNF